MNWRLSPELLDRLAAEYALGTLKGGARRRFEALMQAHPDVARAAVQWSARLMPMAAPQPAMKAGEALWSRIAQRAFGAAAMQRAPWWQRWLGPIPAAALSLGLMLGIGAPIVWQATQADRYDTQLPESYVGVLSTASGRQGLIVSSLRHGKTVDIKVVNIVPIAPGQVLFLWTLDALGSPRAVGALPALDRGFASLGLGQTSEEAFARAVELAVSIEPAGTSPTVPSGAYVYRGQCGKLWRLPSKP